MTTAPIGEFTTYVRTGSIEARPFVADDWRNKRISISATDRENPNGLLGGMVARNPDNHDDQWYIAPEYFAKHYALTAQEQVAGVQDMIINAVRDACSYSYRIGNGLPQNRNTESSYAASEAYAIRYVDAREERLRALAPPYTATKGDA